MEINQLDNRRLEAERERERESRIARLLIFFSLKTTLLTPCTVHVPYPPGGLVMSPGGTSDLSLSVTLKSQSPI